LAAIAAAIAVALGAVPAALAAGSAIAVPCDPADLIEAVGTAPSGSTLILAPDCTYVLTTGLPTITGGLGFYGDDTTIKRSSALILRQQHGQVRRCHQQR
jgi:hypothetical protein